MVTSETNQIIFNHERLDVYRKSLEFVSWLENIIKGKAYNRSIFDQIDRATNSIILNIAEGNAKSSNKDQNRFLEIARASALECAACLDVMLAKKIITNEIQTEGKQMLLIIVKMLYKLSSSVLNK